VLQGKHAVVTGGGSGIGAAVAVALSRAGAKLTLMGRRLEALEARAAELKEARAVAADVSDPEAVAAAFAAAEEGLGGVDILVNSAGLAASSPFLKTSLERLNELMAVNLGGVFLCSRAVLPGMLGRNWGRIVTIASTAGLKGYPYVSAYCASKHAVVGLTRALALEVAKTGVTVNAVCPGYTETAMLGRSLETIVRTTGRSFEEAEHALLKQNPQGRFVQPEEVAAAVLWLCGPGSESVTAQGIALAGGEVV
jgi:NAD(P)-dependent dehydrogenase (short-subunit alcohol dehydrogenase family)